MQPHYDIALPAGHGYGAGFVLNGLLRDYRVVELLMVGLVSVMKTGNEA
nr:hypothetical protein [Niabella agricola]